MKTYIIKFILLFWGTLNVLTINTILAQQNDYVYMENGKFMKGCSDFYPLLVNYAVDIIYARGGFHIAPYKGYCFSSGCGPAWAYCGDNDMEWKLEMGKHLLKISEMGFNVVRIIGLEVNCKSEYIPDKTNWELRSVDYCDQDEDNPNCFYPVIGYQINENTYVRHGDLIKELLVAIKTHNVAHPDKPLKLMLLTGTGGFMPIAEKYASYLDYISERFADEPIIFSYEIISEPFYLGPQFEMTKYQAANMFADFYKVIRKNAPSHLISMGSVPYDVFGWDSKIIPADFNAFHFYPSRKKAYDQFEFEKYKANYYWFSQICEYPWILGEAGLSANDSIHNLDSLYSYLIASEQEQLEFAESTLKHSKHFGAQGYFWWQYKETSWYNIDSAGCWHNYFGLVYYQDNDQTSKPAAEAFENFDPSISCTDCTLPLPSVYYNLNNGQYLAMYGTITDTLDDTIQNAFIVASNQETNYQAYSNEDGYFQILVNDTNDIGTINTLYVSYPGMEKKQVGEWEGDPLQAQQDIQLDTLNGLLLPPHITDIEYLVNEGDTVIWDKPVSSNYDKIIIKTGGLLIIKNDLYMLTEAKIIVERGATLIVNGGRITGTCGIWQGIEVWGTHDMAPDTYGAHGKVIVKNEGIIENAMVGISTIKVLDDEEDIVDMDYTGGQIAVSTGGTFRNCQIGVRFYKYDFNHWSYFSNANFETNTIDDHLPNTQVFMSSVKGIPFKGCTFDVNTNPFNYIPPDERGIGIISYNSSYEVNELCISQQTPCPENGFQPTVFKNLFYGIKAYNTIPGNTFTVNKSLFDQNVRSVYISAVNDITFTRNEIVAFYQNEPIATESYGLYLDQCTGYTVEENYCHNDEADTRGIAMIVNNSGAVNNEIYNNIFDNLDYAILAQNQNRNQSNEDGLQLKCNHFTDNDYDIAVTQSSPNKKYGIAKLQGSAEDTCTAPAGNIFSWTGNNTPSDINNQSSQIIYYYHVNPEYQLQPLFYTSKVTPTPNNHQNAYYDTTLSCPSHFDTASSGGGGSGENLKVLLQQAENEAESVYAMIEALEDAGSTDELKQEVDYSLPPDAMEIYDQLMETSPYLSDTVISAAVEKESVLENAMIRDVLVANPQSAKNDEIIENLEERNNPMPEYMLGQILQGRNLVSVYENLQSKKTFFEHKRSFLYNTLVKYYLSDTLNIESSLDSLARLYSNENNLHANYSLAYLQLNLGQINDGLITLNSIPEKFDLDNDQLAEYNAIVDEYNMLESGIIEPNDTTAIAALMGYALSEYGMATVFARNVLLSLNKIEYMEPILLPEMYKSSDEERYEQLISETTQSKLLEVHPNPGNDHIIVSWKLSETLSEGMLVITDSHGKTRQTVLISGSENQQLIDTRGYEPGIYVISLQTSRGRITSEKFTISN